MTTGTITRQDAVAASLAADGWTLTYAAEVTGGWFADLRGADGRCFETGLGATQSEALAHLAERLQRHGGDLGGLLAAVLAEGHAVSFTGDPEGTVAHIDVVKDDDTVTTHTGIADTAAGALEAAAFGAGLISEDCGAGDHDTCGLTHACGCQHHDPREQLTQARADMRVLIRALADLATTARQLRDDADKT